MANIFGRVLVDEDILAIALELGGRVVEREFFYNRDFSINLCKKSILLLSLAWTSEIVVVTTDIIMLAIDCLREGSMGRSDGK